MAKKDRDPTPIGYGEIDFHAPARPPVIFNPASGPTDALVWGAAELRNLYLWLHLVQCSNCEFEIDPRELAAMVTERLQLIRDLFAAQLESQGVVA